MTAPAVIAVLGTCATQRSRFARLLADSGVRQFVPLADSPNSSHALSEAVSLCSSHAARFGTVMDCASSLEPTELISAFVHFHHGITLPHIVCVVDAENLLHTLRPDIADRCALALHDSENHDHSLLTVHQIEYASHVILVNWSHIPTEDAALTLALLSHLATHASLQLDQHSDTLPPLPDSSNIPSYEHPSWVHILNNEFSPMLTHPRVSFFRYDQLRPLHPHRLFHFLEQLEAGVFGHVIRSAGFCRFATRPTQLAQWDHAGAVICFHPLACDHMEDDDPEMMSIGQELVFIGVDLDSQGLNHVLDHVMLTDEEFLQGSSSWMHFDDPFPLWSPHHDSSD